MQSNLEEMLSYGVRKGIRVGMLLSAINCLFLFAISPTMDLPDIVRPDVFFPMLGLVSVYVVGSVLRYRKTTPESEYLERKSREGVNSNQEA